MSVEIYRAVDWHVPPKNGDYMPSYRTCDICEYSATDDIGNAPNWLEIRDWVKTPDGCSVCSHCIEHFFLDYPVDAVKAQG